MNKLNILYVDSLAKGSTVTEFYRAFKNHKSCRIYSLFEESKINLWANSYNLKNKIMYKLGIMPDKLGLNEKVLNFEFDKHKIDIVFIGAPKIIKRSTLKELKELGVYLISFTNDDLFLKHYKLRNFLNSLKYYNLFITMNIDSYIYNYINNGIPDEKIFPINKSFSKHYAVDIFNTIDCHKSIYSHDILFIGSYEDDRFNDILYLANKIEEKIHIYGPYNGRNGWRQKEKAHNNIIIHNHMLIEREYIEAIKCSKINLAFLRSKNNDTQTSRTFEIPAYGGFMLMQSTKQQKIFFNEGNEAEFFSNKEELLEKVKYYLKNDSSREKIRARGREICFKNNYAFESKVDLIVDKISNDIAKKHIET